MITQSNRLLQVHTSLGDNALIATQLIGEEGLSINFRFVLTAFSQLDEINCMSLLNENISIRVNDPKTPLIIHGIISEILTKAHSERLTCEYNITVVPWLELLNVRKNCQIYQQQSVLDIFSAICKSAGFYDFSLKKLSKNYPKLNYVVQYNESSSSFLQRILAEAGIFYYYDHHPKQHVLMLADEPGMLSNIGSVDISNSPFGEHIQRLEPKYKLTSTTLTGNSYHYKMPKESDLFSINQLHKQQVLGNQNLEAYYYFGQNAANTHEMIKQRLAIHNQEAYEISGFSNIKNFSSGKRFLLNQTDYLLQTIHHKAYDYTHLSHENVKKTQDYQNHFTCLATNVKYYPKIFSFPPISGLQLATVTTLNNQTISTEKYAEVRVKFSWQNHYIDTENTHWLRVSQYISGIMGGQFMPRADNKVLLGFSYGEMTQAFILRSIYNNQNLPFSLNKATCGIKTQSLEGTGNNEISFTDDKGSENMQIFTQNNFAINVNHHEFVTIENQYNLRITGNHTILIKLGKSVLSSPKKIIIKAGSSKITLNTHSLCIEGNTINLGA